MISAQSSDPTVKIYASRFKDGELGLMIVNENDKNRTTVLDLSGYQTKGQFLGWVLSGDGLDKPRVSWNGEWGPGKGGGPFPIDTIKPYRGILKTGKPLQLNIASHSVSGIILY